MCLSSVQKVKDQRQSPSGDVLSSVEASMVLNQSQGDHSVSPEASREPGEEEKRARDRNVVLQKEK